MQLPMSTSGPKVKRAQLDHMSLPQWDIVTSNYKAQVRAVSSGGVVNNQKSPGSAPWTPLRVPRLAMLAVGVVIVRHG